MAANIHFESLYLIDGKWDIDAHENIFNNIPNIIIMIDNEVLFQKVTEEEILGVLQQMNLDKATRSDGFSSHFYLIYWHIIKQYLVRMVQYVQKSTRMGGNKNSSFLSLFPKE
jgi:hypothetical protein